MIIDWLYRFIEGMSKEQIKKLAYSYYEDRNYQMGNSEEDWNRAKKEVLEASCVDISIFFLLFVGFILCTVFLPAILMPLVIFWGVVFFIVFVTFYTSVKKIVFERLFRFLRATFISLLAAVPAFTFSFQYWPELNIVQVENVRSLGLRPENIKNSKVSHIPDAAAVMIKNSSSAVVRDAEIRYWLVMKSDEKQDQCTLTYSTANEKFSFGPEEERSFEFDFGTLKNKALEKTQTHAIHLIVEVRYRPLLFPFKGQRRWQVFYYSNAEGHWVTQRKDHWKEFNSWYQELKQASAYSKLSLPVCIAEEKETQSPTTIQG
ncbi:MAG: hypothetical protein A3G33_00105 [Omnitrophica bacterium RIFCSPLOWO2_12_FULL_44_17]|uniref:Uncharacterized protein n=1 Tax=Candidatus Danuiimicrobium aquiferis TaxID=1801832 RepID=A0A1G1L0U5_9BACT|nr:MAG: hypothetical protein A3E74_00290 [Omnitrophica bacterium RIFCSPHIGHO2_12_FULL_44_12]OGW98764.1 MAG: hypothetical protein A3G33_00105 [Omnitrophica bacterium RIFCSPLOWO2_12_FULL_44_17]OGX03768.1 MAG: hypothetical protein A3J12_00090 [Omnitrophica bacterium RIFCSPLOWO2_02_FULL_44_11]